MNNVAFRWWDERACMLGDKGLCLDAQVNTLADGSVDVTVSLHVPNAPIANWQQLEADFREACPKPVSSLTVEIQSDDVVRQYRVRRYTTGAAETPEDET